MALTAPFNIFLWNFALFFSSSKLRFCQSLKNITLSVVEIRAAAGNSLSVRPGCCRWAWPWYFWPKFWQDWAFVNAKTLSKSREHNGTGCRDMDIFVYESLYQNTLWEFVLKNTSVRVWLEGKKSMRVCTTNLLWEFVLKIFSKISLTVKLSQTCNPKWGPKQRLHRVNHKGWEIVLFRKSLLRVCQDMTGV